MTGLYVFGFCSVVVIIIGFVMKYRYESTYGLVGGRRSKLVYKSLSGDEVIWLGISMLIISLFSVRLMLKDK